MSRPPAPVDVVVVGAGVIGLAVGWRTAERGLSVTVLDRGEPGQETSRVAAGMIAPIAEATPTEPALLALSRASAELYPQFVEDLRSRGGIDPGLLSRGTLLVARDGDEAEALERELRFREGLGLSVRRLLAREARALEPALAPTLRLGMEIPEDHAVDPRALCRALADAFLAAGGVLRTRTQVDSIVCQGGRVRGVRLSDGACLRAERTVIAAGPWSGAVGGLPEGARVPLRPVKGQLLCLRDPEGPGRLDRVLRMQPGYLVPRGDGRYVLGASVEERGFDTTVTAGPMFELLRDAIELVPALHDFTLEELLAGVRPGTPDNLPVLGVGALEGLHWATGHYRHGVLLAPITAEILAASLAGDPPPLDVDAFLPTRFAPQLAGGLAA